MSDTILGGDLTVYYGAENRQKRIVWTGSATGTRTVNQLYSALQDLFDELPQMDDGVPMSAQTPTEYTIGIIDAGDKDPWFIDRTTVEHLTGGALKTASWDRVTGTNTGIVKVVCNNTDIVAGDIGLDITLTGGNVGTLLDVKGTGAGSILWIRPDDNTTTHDFDDAGTLTCNAHTATWTSVTSAGESLWANIYSIGTIEANTHIYIYQNGANLVAYKASTDWWSDGHIDILVNVKELGTETDEGYITVAARQYSKTYSYYIVDLTNGGRNPIPLQTGNDLDNQTGYWRFTAQTGTGTGTFVVGEVISKSGTDKKGILTAVGGTSATPILTYYLIGDPITNFANGDTSVTGATSSATCTAGTPAAFGPAALDPAPTITHGGLADGGSYDIDENGTPENYSIVIDCNQNSLANVYQWCKYVTRRKETGTTPTDGIEGEQYIGSDFRLRYTGAITGTITEGNTCSQAGTGAKGTIVEKNTTDKIIILRNARGTFNTSGLVTDDTAGGTVTPDAEASAITPIASAPFGTFAGGKFFCAPGIVLTYYLTADLNNFQLVDDNGTVRVAPTKVNVTIGNTRQGDRVAAFRLTGSGGDIKKDTYSATAQAVGATTAVVSETIGTDEPGKTAGGILRLVDVSANTEYRIRFSSWTTSTFTLASASLTPEAGTNSTTVVDTGAFTEALCKVGDLIYNTTRTAASYVISRDSDNQVTISPAISGQVETDTISKNVLPVATTTSDKYYVPFIDAYETTGTDGTPGSETVQIVLGSTVYVRVRARRSGSLSNRIIPFEQDSSIGTTGMNVSVIRTLDTIVT